MTDFKKLIEKLNNLTTERINPRSVDIDKLSPLEITRLINSEDQQVAAVVATQLEPIAEAAQIFASTLKNNGRVFYIGAGTSGRLGVLDAAECPPTFGTEPEQIIGVISGGYDTLILSQEGVEDQADQALLDLKNHNLTENDFVIGIAASSRTPYTLSGLAYAKEVGCKNCFITCNAFDKNEHDFKIDIVITLEVGPEIITGSTRMKSGTAQKLTLNLISTTAMVLMGKTYGNLMVDLQARSDKLTARSRKILIDLFAIDFDEADQLLKEAEGSVKVAIVMKQKTCSKNEAIDLLIKADGFISNIK